MESWYKEHPWDAKCSGMWLVQDLNILGKGLSLSLLLRHCWDTEWHFWDSPSWISRSPPLSLRKSGILQVCFSPFASIPFNPGSFYYRSVLIFSLTWSLTNQTQITQYLLQNFPQPVLGPGEFCFPADCQGCTIGIFARQGIQKAVKLHRQRLLELLQVFVN